MSGYGYENSVYVVDATVVDVGAIARSNRNWRKRQRRARRRKPQKPRGTRQRIAGLCRRLDREGGR